MSALVAEIMKLHLIYPNPSSKWECAPLIVSERVPAHWRLAVDSRPVDKGFIRGSTTSTFFSKEGPVCVPCLQATWLASVGKVDFAVVCVHVEALLYVGALFLVAVLLGSHSEHRSKLKL